MDALEMSLLYDYYGGLLTGKQRQCFDLRYNQDLSLGEIAQVMGCLLYTSDAADD